MLNSKTALNIVISVFVLVAIVVGYLFLNREKETDVNLKSTSGAVLVLESKADLSQTDKEFLDILVNLKTLKLDVSIFANPAFINLSDFGQKLNPEPKGRPNPFAPLSSPSSSGSKSQ